MRRLVVIAVMLVIAALAAPASAANAGLSLSIDRVSYVSKTFVDVDVSYTCTAPRVSANRHVEFDWPGVYVAILQNSGSRIAAAEGWLDLDGNSTCDGSVHTVTVTAMVDPYTRPLKPGRAMICAGIDMSYYWWNEKTGRDGYVEQWTELAWTPVRLQR